MTRSDDRISERLRVESRWEHSSGMGQVRIEINLFIYYSCW